MDTRTILLAMAVVGGLVVAGVARQPQESAKPRIGVYDSRAIAVAYVQTQGDNKRLQQLAAELKQADAAGDQRRAADIRARGARLQTLRHLQGFSTAPVDDMLESIGPRLPQIAGDNGLIAIVAGIDFADQAVEVVDVTDQLVAEFRPNQKTLQTIAELRSKRPAPLIEILATNPQE